MGTRKTSSITTEQLWENGWKRQKDAVFPAKKVIGKSKDIGELSLIVHQMKNVPMFAISLPDGGLINFNPGSIEELNAFEKMIISYDPPY